MALSWSMDKLGPLCRSLDDAELVFAAILGPDGRDPSVLDVPYVRPAALELGKLRIGVPRGAFERMDEVAGVRAELEALGHELVEVDLPDYPVDEMLLVLMAEAATAFDELTRSGDDDLLVRQQAGAWPNLFRAARLIPAVEYLRAQRLRTRLCQDMHAALAGVDLLVHPPFAGGLLGITNLTGHPTVVAPYGQRRDGSPNAICFTGQLFDEGTLLGVASAWQRATGFHLRHPTMEYLDGEPAEDR
jgi:Asp-tRNA(Asn)/Glu-tRNA(Gln) amidotransferase A subunit family amidase